MDLQYKSVVNFPPSKVPETSKNCIEVLEMVVQTEWFFFAITVSEKPRGGVHKHFFDRDAFPRTNFNYPKK